MFFLLAKLDRRQWMEGKVCTCHPFPSYWKNKRCLAALYTIDKVTVCQSESIKKCTRIGFYHIYHILLKGFFSSSETVWICTLCSTQLLHILTFLEQKYFGFSENIVKTMRILKGSNYYLLAWIWYNRWNPDTVSNHSKNSLFQFLKSLSYLKVIQKQIWKSIAFAVYF